MLAEGSNARTVTRGACLGILLLLSLSPLAFTSPGRADAVWRNNPDSSVTWEWAMNSTGGLRFNGTALTAGNATLQWDSAVLSWSHVGDLVANASSASNMTATPSGLTLASNPSNRIPNGNFADAGAWTYTNGTGAPYRVNASWSPNEGRAALLQHLSPSTETLWNSMDSSANWLFVPMSGAAIGQVYEETSGQMEGSGMLGMNITAHSGAFSASAVWNLLPSPANNANWSAVDRLVLWIKDNASLGLSFNLTAVNAKTSVTMTTPAQPLVAGWQEVVVDLDQLGSSTARENLSSVWLEVNGPSTVPANTWIYFDDVRVGLAKAFVSDAQVSQSFTKANASSPNPGSAYLSFDWCLCNTTGVASISPSFVLAGPGGSYASGLAASPPAHWAHLSLDASQWTTSAGSYSLTFGFFVAANDTAASNATLWIDNATFLFPDVHNGTYLSLPIGLGSDSQMVAMTWAAATPPTSSVQLSLRTGSSASSWSAWHRWSLPGTYPLSVEPGAYVQIQADLNTTNASVAPTFASFSLTSRHYPASGTVTSDSVLTDVAPNQAKFLRWRSISAVFQSPSSTNVSFVVGNGSTWTPVPASGSLAAYPSATMQWRAILATSDGIVTPALAKVSVTYEYVGNPAAVLVAPGGPVDVAMGGSVQFTATAVDSGNHSLSGILFDWHTSDPSGQVTNGLYVAGQPGTWNVTAVAVGWGVSQTVQVRVTGTAWAALWPFVAAIGVLAVLALAGYEVAVRRMYAIDDVFLIAKDGRLILHNTRRMRADRDEDILSGMLTAIMAFLRDQDPEENGELKRFAVGGKTTLLERGEHVYLSAVYSGRVPRWAAKDLHRFMVDLEDRFGARFATWNGSPEELRDLKEYMRRFVSRVRYRGDPNASQAET